MFKTIDKLKEYLSDDRLGFYSCIEVFEIVAIPKDGSATINIFTLCVAIENINTKNYPKNNFINDHPIKINSLKNWKFGILRYTCTIENLCTAIENLTQTNIFNASGNTLQLGKLTVLPPQFTPKNQFDEIPLNNVLKNNFWNGSYSFEFFDQSKLLTKFLFDSPDCLLQLSSEIQKYIPITIAKLSDRVGNLIIQIPINIVVNQFLLGCDKNYIINTAWHPKSEKRPLRGTCEFSFDGVVLGYCSKIISSEQTILELDAGRGVARTIIYDEENNLILADSGEHSFIGTISSNIRPIHPEPRVFEFPTNNIDINIKREETRITLSHSGISSQIGEGQFEELYNWKSNRLFDEELTKLTNTKAFIQYNPKSTNYKKTHLEAIKDIRTLISQHGNYGVYLWDPYLNAEDIINTLFYCPHYGVPLRAITSAETTSKNKQTKNLFIQQQNERLQNLRSNFEGLNLEYRVKYGNSGWGFHDRFLIFPHGNRTKSKCWSLGTSINSLGESHHILQKVENSQLIVQAFEDLWNQLYLPKNLIWKYPN